MRLEYKHKNYYLKNARIHVQLRGEAHKHTKHTNCISWVLQVTASPWETEPPCRLSIVFSIL